MGAGLRFPLLCKPIQAHGAGGHEMTLVFNHVGCSNVTLPCVAQEFVQHGAVVFKVSRTVVVARSLSLLLLLLSPLLLGEACFAEFLFMFLTVSQVFVVDSYFSIDRRPSIRDLEADKQRENIEFDSHSVSKTGSASDLNEVLLLIYSSACLSSFVSLSVPCLSLSSLSLLDRKGRCVTVLFLSTRALLPKWSTDCAIS